MYAAMALERVKNEAVWLGYKFQKKEYSEYQEKLIQEENATKEAEKTAKKEAKEAEKAAKKAEKEAKKAEKIAAKEAKDTEEPRFFTKEKFNIREFLRRKPKEEEDDVEDEEFVEDVETGETTEAIDLGREVKNIFKIDPETQAKVFEFKVIPDPDPNEVSFTNLVIKARRTKGASVFKNTRESVSPDLIGYNEIMMKIRESEEIFDYCMYLMKDDGDEPVIFETDDEEFKKFCNCICYAAAKYKPYEDTEIGYLENYNLASDKCNAKYYMKLEDFRDNNIITSPDDQCPFEEDKAEETKLESAFHFKTVEEKELEVPIKIFNKEKEEEKAKPAEEATVKEDFSELDAIFAGLIGKSDHRWERWNGIYTLYIARDEDSADQYIVDDGRIMGTATYSILADTETGDTIFVPISMRNICKKVLKSKENKLTEKEVKSISSKMFTCDIIYRFVDFSEVGSTIDLFTAAEAKTFENRLKLIVDEMIEKAKGEMSIVPRLRFTEFKDHNTFTLISDDKVVSPLASIGATSSVIVDGLKYVSTKETIEQFTKGSTVPAVSMKVISSEKK